MIINDNILSSENHWGEGGGGRASRFNFNNSILLVTLSTKRIVGFELIIIAIQLHSSYSITNHKVIVHAEEKHNMSLRHVNWNWWQREMRICHAISNKYCVMPVKLHNLIFVSLIYLLAVSYVLSLNSSVISPNWPNMSPGPRTDTATFDRVVTFHLFLDTAISPDRIKYMTFDS